MEPSGQAKERETEKQRRDLEADITQTALSWKQLERIAQDRRLWRDVVRGLCSRSSTPYPSVCVVFWVHKHLKQLMVQDIGKFVVVIMALYVLSLCY